MSDPVELVPVVPAKFRPVTRTVIQVLVAVAVFVPILVTQLGVDPEQTPWLAAVVAVAAAVARWMQTDTADALMVRVGLGRGPGRHEA